MKRFIVMATALTLGLSACGASHKAQLQTIQNNPQAKQDTAKAQRIYHHCVPHPYALRSKAVRDTALKCAVPPQNRQPAIRCEVNGLLGHLPTVARVERVTLGCIGKYA